MNRGIVFSKGFIKKGWPLLFYLLSAGLAYAQDIKIKGVVIDIRNKRGIQGAKVFIEGDPNEVSTSSDGVFELNANCVSDCMLIIFKSGYNRLRLPIEKGESRELGVITMSRNNPVEKHDVLLNLTETDLNEEDGVSDVVGFLQGSRDIFLNRAAFDFSQSFFRVRGYDSSERQVHINGLPVNNMVDGRPQWNNWGGLNDVMRYATHTMNLDISRTSFEGLMGGVNFTIRPTQMRPGTRFTNSFSNRSYANRLMATHTSGNRDGKLSYAFSISRRWAEEGYIEGTSYNAYSLFGSLELSLGQYSSLYAFAMNAYNLRGRSAPITQEVFELAGRTYNPYWGIQGNRRRNSRNRMISEPLFMINYQRIKDRFRLRMGLGYQFGKKAVSRLGYFQAPNPDPTYYRNLPSFYFNNRFGDYTVIANEVVEEFRSDGQLSWESLYRANSYNPTGKASYLDYSDESDSRQIIAGGSANLKISKLVNLDLGISYRAQNSENYGLINDLLGAEFHNDIDPFSNTRNDLNGLEKKVVGDRFSYSYLLKLKSIKAYAQLELQLRKWSAFISVGWETRSFQRRGLFLNGRYPKQSFGKGPEHTFSGFGLKAGIGYSPTSRVRVNLLGTERTGLPTPRDLFINPRDNNNSISYNELPQITSMELNTILRLKRIMGRISLYSTWFRNNSEIGFYYTDSGLGSDFVQEVLTNINSWHRGVEFGLEYSPSSTVSLSIAGTFASYQYVNNPFVTLYFDVTEGDQNPIDPSGKVELGQAMLKGLFLPRGPQNALSLGITYRDPDFWFVSGTLNELSRNYIDLSILPRTSSFYLDPENRSPVNNIDTEFINSRLEQDPLPKVYLFNIVGGKSWLIKGKYLGIFASINNLFDTTFRTGGFEQNRNGNYKQFVKDAQNNHPSFAPKFWYGYGRTYFLNLSLSF